MRSEDSGLALSEQCLELADAVLGVREEVGLDLLTCLHLLSQLKQLLRRA